jgi:hypothetical protein
VTLESHVIHVLDRPSIAGFERYAYSFEGVFMAYNQQHERGSEALLYPMDPLTKRGIGLLHGDGGFMLPSVIQLIIGTFTWGKSASFNEGSSGLRAFG